MKWQDHITSDPQVLGGKPIIKGTRLSVEFILERLADGWTEDMLLENFSSLTKDTVHALRDLQRN